MAVIFDLEGVLIDNRERIKYALSKINNNITSPEDLSHTEKTLFWRIYFDAKLAEKMDKVFMTGISELLKRSKKGFRIFIVSGSPKEIVLIHMRKIRKALQQFSSDISIDDIIWRPSGDRRKAEEFKKSVVRNIILFRGLTVEEVHDDNPAVIESFKSIARKRYLWKDGEIIAVFT